MTLTGKPPKKPPNLPEGERKSHKKEIPHTSLFSLPMFFFLLPWITQVKAPVTPSTRRELEFLFLRRCSLSCLFHDPRSLAVIAGPITSDNRSRTDFLPIKCSPHGARGKYVRIYEYSDAPSRGWGAPEWGIVSKC